MGPGVIELFLENWQIFLKGAIGTLQYAAIAVLIGSLFGAIFAMFRLQKNPFLRWIAVVYITVIRGTPLLVQMYIAYYFIPIAFPSLNVFSKSQFVVMALVLNSAAYVAEIFRSGILAVDEGQFEAAASLGLRKWYSFRYIILPQAIKNILPSLANEYITMIKETSLAGTMMLYELMYTKVIFANKYIVWQPLFIVAAIYLALTLVLSYGVSILERRLAQSDH